MSLREYFISLCDSLGIKAELNPTQDVIEARFQTLKNIVEEIGVKNFSQIYVQLLKDEKISLLEPQHLFCGSKEYEDKFDREFDQMGLKFLENHPEVVFDSESRELWEIPYIVEYDKALLSEYQEIYNFFCINFYESNLFQLTPEELITGLRRSHDYGEFGLKDEEIEEIKSLTSNLISK